MDTPPLPEPQQNPIVPDDDFSQAIMAAVQETTAPKSDMIREPDPDETLSRKALVKQWSGKVKSAKERYDDVFKQMKDDMEFLRGKQWETNADSKEKYVANLVQRHLQQTTSSLYAKNPKVVCKRRKTMDFVQWDESRSQLLELQAQLQPPAMPVMPPGMPPMVPNWQPPPEAVALMSDVEQGIARRKLLDRIARTMEIVFKYQLDEHQPPFKEQMKQLVRRTCTTSVGWVKIGYQRFMKKRPEDVEKITDLTQKLHHVQRLIDDAVDGETDLMMAEAEQLRLTLQTLQQAKLEIVKEGLVFDFPRSNQVIVDPKCTHLPSLNGCQWIAHEFVMTIDDIKEIYGVDVGKDYKHYETVNSKGDQLVPIDQTMDDKTREGVSPKNQACVWEIYEKTSAMVYTVCEGYPDFLKEPSEPDIKIDRFWPCFCLCFNVHENDLNIYPMSDVALMRPMQREYNRCREGLREQRHANRPKYGVPAGALDPEDMEKLENHPANAVMQLRGLNPGQKVEDVIQVIKPAPIDPALYDTSMIFDDVQRVAGDQEANIGGAQGNVTATESGIAESNRMTSISSKSDDLEDMLNQMMRAAGKVLFLMMDPQTVQKIAGKGSVWPQLNPQQIADELLLEIEAGTAGRPNRTAEIANFDRLAPILLQIPGISPEWIAKQAIKRLDDNLDATDAIQDGLQSIIAQNAQKQVSTGNPGTDPNQQGGAPQNVKAPHAPSGPMPGSTPPNVPGVPPQVMHHIPQPANQNQ